MSAIDMRPDAKWWDARWKYRIPVDLPISYFDRRDYAVEAALDFQRILEIAGEKKKFNKDSIRVVEHDREDNPLCELPAVYRSKSNPASSKEKPYLSWLINAKARERKRYYIYFDTSQKDLGPSPTGPLPPPNIVENSDFEKVSTDGLPSDWQVSNPAHFALERYKYTIGKKSLKIFISKDNFSDVVRQFTVSQKIDARRFRGDPVLFGCDLFLAEGELGLPVSLEIRQFREDGSEIIERVVDPRWLTIEVARGQIIQFCERGCISHQAATIVLELSVKAAVNDIDTGEAVHGPETFFTLFLDNVSLRPSERLPIPYLNKCCYKPGAISTAPLNRGLELKGRRRLVFNGRSQGTLTTWKYNPDARSIHWGIRQGTLEFYFKPYWGLNDPSEHTFVDLTSWARERWRFRLFKPLKDDAISLQISDSRKKLHELTAPISLQKDTWHHIACTWDFDKPSLQIFLDGKRIRKSEPTEEPWPSNPDGIDTEPTMPLQLVVGNSDDGGRSAEGVIDELRVSDVVRYTEEFDVSEPSEFALDDATRALFHFEEDKHGIHSGDDRFVKSFLFCEEHLSEDYVVLEINRDSRIVSRRVVISPRPPESLFDRNLVENVVDVHRRHRVFPDERRIDFQYREEEATFEQGKRETSIEVGGDYSPLTRSLTIEPAGEGSYLVSPRILGDGDIDPSSYLTLRETLPISDLEDGEKAIMVFQYALAVTNYYDNKAREIIAGKERKIGRSFIKHLNIYPFHQCGPLNHFLRRLFLTFGLSSNQFSGTGHSFEQVFYEGQWHIFDLAERRYFLDRDCETIMSLSKLEDDPYMAEKNKGPVYIYLPARMRGKFFSQRHRHHSMGFTLRPRECVKFYWYNTGKWLDTGPKGSKMPISAMPPHYGNGEISFKPDFTAEDLLHALDVNGKVDRSLTGKSVSPANKGKPISLTYRRHWPYILVGGELEAEMWKANSQDTCAVYLSLDEGVTWQEIFRKEKTGLELVSLDFRDKVKSRYTYCLRLDMMAAARPEDVGISDLKIVTVFYHSPLALPGKLRLGTNRLGFRRKSMKSPAKITYQWVERSVSDLCLELNSISFYRIEEESNMNLYVVEPGKAMPVEVKLRGSSGEGKVFLKGLPDRWLVEPKTINVSLEKSEFNFRVTPPQDEKTPNLCWFDLVTQSENTQRIIKCQTFLTHPILALEAEHTKKITDGIRIAEATDASNRKYAELVGPQGAQYDFDAEKGGDHALWIRACIPNEKSDSITVTVDNTKNIMLESKCDSVRNLGSSKIFLTNGERYGFWQWYRVGPFRITVGKHRIRITSQESGAKLDALLIIPDDCETRELATHLLQNRLFMPWERIQKYTTSAQAH